MKKINDIPSGVSMESAAYMENNINDVQKILIIILSSDEIIEEYTPKLFSEEQSFQENTDREIMNQLKMSQSNYLIKI